MAGDQTRLIVKDLKKPVGGKVEDSATYLNVHALAHETQVKRDLALIACMSDVLSELKKLNLYIETILE